MAWIVQRQMSSVKKDSHCLSFNNIHINRESITVIICNNLSLWIKAWLFVIIRRKFNMKFNQKVIIKMKDSDFYLLY